MGTFVKVAKTRDLAEGGMVAVTLGNTEVLLARVQGQYYAISNVCSHADAWLDRGDLPEPDSCPGPAGRHQWRGHGGGGQGAPVTIITEQPYELAAFGCGHYTASGGRAGS